MSIYIGDGAIGYNKISPDSTGNILRFLQSDRHTPRVEDGLEHSLATRKQMLVQLDSYGDGSNRGWHNDQNLINFTEQIKVYVIERANAHGISYPELKKFCRFTFDNEGDEIYSTQEYGHYLDVFAGQMAGKFEIGAGNFNGHRTDYYNYILQNHKNSFQWLDFHQQKDFETVAKVNSNIGYYHDMAIRYGKKLACTEGNPTSNNIWSSSGFSLLHHQLTKSIEIGCKGFYFVFIHQPMDNNHSKISFILNNNVVNPYWQLWKEIIKDNKPIDEVFDMYGIEINYVKPGCHNEECRAVQQIMLDEGYDLEPFGADSWYGIVTETAINDWQAANDLKVDGWVGKETWQWIFENIDTGMLRFMQMIARTGRYK